MSELPAVRDDRPQFSRYIVHTSKPAFAKMFIREYSPRDEGPVDQEQYWKRLRTGAQRHPCQGLALPAWDTTRRRVSLCHARQLVSWVSLFPMHCVAAVAAFDRHIGSMIIERLRGSSAMHFLSDDDMKELLPAEEAALATFWRKNHFPFGCGGARHEGEHPETRNAPADLSAEA